MGKLYERGFTQNRELSWLKFNDRVLSEAMDETVPILERLKFISIFTSNLDEFFMIRVGSLFDLANLEKKNIDNKSGLTPKEQLSRIFEDVKPLYQKREQLFYEVESQLRLHGVFYLKYKELEENEKKQIKQSFKLSIAPILSPQIIDTHHPFPHLANNIIYIGVMLRHKKKEVFGVIPVPSILPDIFYLPGSDTRYIGVENIILEFADKIFEPYIVVEKTVFCVTRNADVNPDDEVFADEPDFRKRMQKVLGQRRRLAPVRLELSNFESEKISAYLMEKLKINEKQIYTTTSPLKMAYVYELISKLPESKRKPLVYQEFTPVWPGNIKQTESMIQQVEKSDLLLSYPYESMEPFLKLLKEAANDPSVISIKITIYRLASKAKLVEYLCAAAENGKSVTVLIELRARFDEQNNIDWSERLEDAGCNIIYGFDFYKVHSKICLITKKGRNGIRYLTQVGTGNYNEKTAKLYTDLSLLTYNQKIGEDAAEFFKNMSIANLQGEYHDLLVAPVSLKSTVLQLIDQEISKGQNGRIFIKINSLTDAQIIEKLAEASCAGVQVKMIIRGICCIIPGIPGKTENIQVCSIVGRYLEHARIYCFGYGTQEQMYISSADFMTRNTERRVEVACPIYDEKVRAKIHEIIEAQEYDNQKARVLMADGNYVKKSTMQEMVDSQQLLMDYAIQNVSVPITQETKKRRFIFGQLLHKWRKNR
ncbi:polyphosphate kinase 1 [Massilioclostridium coli]|uniref:polyphosphate kinase 1 n=1 Tax=Massilioclostridium coli TaxID=1870991 RepID=UPI00085C1F94|nr:polyphosphate kinase 1 [Massilioclostridium coli]